MRTDRRACPGRKDQSLLSQPCPTADAPCAGHCRGDSRRATARGAAIGFCVEAVSGGMGPAAEPTQAHNLKVAGSNPAPATKFTSQNNGLQTSASDRFPRRFFVSVWCPDSGAFRNAQGRGPGRLIFNSPIPPQIHHRSAALRAAGETSRERLRAASGPGIRL